MSCKTSNIATTVSPTPEQAPKHSAISSDTLELRSPVYITQIGDTLRSLNEEVDVAIYPLDPDTLTIIGVGDIMLGTNYPSAEFLPPLNGSTLLQPVSDILTDADITFGNYEGVIIDEGGIPKECKNPKLCYLFRTPEEYAKHLPAAGFDVMSLANNHAGDFGEEGRQSSARVLTGLGIAVAGTHSIPYTIFESNKTTIGLAAFAPNSGTISLHDYQRAKDIIQHLDSMCQIVIVSFHAGAEGPDHQHVRRQREYFVGEDRGNVYEFARMAIDAGADVVFGHGPHVTRAIDVYKERFIAYSLGNFCTYRRFNLTGPNGLAPIVKLWVTQEGTFIRGQLFSTYQPGSGGPFTDTSQAVLKLVQRLTKEDIPEAPLEISDDGLITLKMNN